MPAALSLLLIAQLTLPAAVPPPEGRAGRGDLVALADSSPRPRECRADPAREWRSRTWTRVRRPELELYCDALARGYAALERDPGAALRASEQADRALPNRAAPDVLAARALAALGKPSEAWDRFARALALDRRAVEDPRGLWALARAAASSQKPDEALRAYRALVPRARFIGQAAVRVWVYVEAAAAAANRGPAGLPEASGYLAEARRQAASPGAAPLVLGAQALALDRLGRHEEALGLAADVGGFEPPAGVLLPPGELEAIQAMLAEGESPAAAVERWEASIALRPANDPWLEHAKSSLARVTKVARTRGSR